MKVLDFYSSWIYVYSMFHYFTGQLPNPTIALIVTNMLGIEGFFNDFNNFLLSFILHLVPLILIFPNFELLDLNNLSFNIALLFIYSQVIPYHDVYASETKHLTFHDYLQTRFGSVPVGYLFILFNLLLVGVKIYQLVAPTR